MNLLKRRCHCVSSASFILVGLVLASLTHATFAQTTAMAPPSPEMEYYDFWPGTWIRLVNGKVDKSASSFRVSRSIHGAAFEEEWRLVTDNGDLLRARAIRAWDQVTNRWMFAWVSDNALFQVWDGRKYGDRWYIVREFEVSGRKFLSRQAWWPEGPDHVIRISERSFDGGVNWELRFREEYQRVRAKAEASKKRISKAVQDSPSPQVKSQRSKQGKVGGRLQGYP